MRNVEEDIIPFKKKTTFARPLCIMQKNYLYQITFPLHTVQFGLMYTFFFFFFSIEIDFSWY